MVLVATDNFDVSGDPEEPAVRALEELVPAWRRRDMSLRVRIVSDWPTPGLAEAAARFGAELVPSGGDLVGALSTARVVLSPVNHGTSVSSWVPAAMAAGTPWLTTEKAVTGTYLDDIEARAVVADVATMGHRGWALLTDEATWAEFSAAISVRLGGLVAEREAALRTALLGAGIDPPEGPRWPVERWSALPAALPVRVPLRPAAVADPPCGFRA